VIIDKLSRTSLSFPDKQQDLETLCGPGTHIRIWKPRVRGAGLTHRPWSRREYIINSVDNVSHHTPARDAKRYLQVIVGINRTLDDRDINETGSGESRASTPGISAQHNTYLRIPSALSVLTPPVGLKICAGRDPCTPWANPVGPTRPQLDATHSRRSQHRRLSRFSRCRRSANCSFTCSWIPLSPLSPLICRLIRSGRKWVMFCPL